MSRALVVDDSASMRKMVVFTLRLAGVEVVEAEDGEVAMELARAEKFELVLTDVNMPGMDGIALVRSLRQLADYKFTPLLMLTTESAPEKKLEGKAAGATGWLVKPFNPEQLVAIVQRVLGRANPGNLGETGPQALLPDLLQCGLREPGQVRAGAAAPGRRHV